MKNSPQKLVRRTRGRDTNLTLTLADGTTAVIENFTSGNLGLQIVDVPVDPTLTTYGSGTAASEILIGGGEVYGRGGDDIILGSTALDIMQGDGGNDTLYGNGSQITTQVAIDNGNTDTATNLNGDWLAGGAGDDIVIAGANNDILVGGGGNDLLIAGAGGDFIYGDVDFNADLGYGGSILKLEQLANGAWQFTAPNLVPDPVDSGNDTLYAGNGADHVWAGQGNDVVYGEAGDDQIVGEDGNDILTVDGGFNTLFGGTGNDINVLFEAGKSMIHAANDAEGRVAA
ncbi:MAG: calcium-binding protein [Sideroxyarcus sp.]|nr:calcium-binding protein [Sideroxyarcus sp.]